MKGCLKDLLVHVETSHIIDRKQSHEIYKDRARSIRYNAGYYAHLFLGCRKLICERGFVVLFGITTRRRSTTQAFVAIFELTFASTDGALTFEEVSADRGREFVLVFLCFSLVLGGFPRTKTKATQTLNSNLTKLKLPRLSKSRPKIGFVVRKPNKTKETHTKPKDDSNL